MALAQEGTDVCNIRPDLCDEGGGTPEPEVTRTVRPPQRRAPAPVKQQRRKLKPRKQTRSRTTSRNCRVAGAPYNLNNVDLPICGSASVAAARPPAKNSAAFKKAGRRPASTMDVEAYMSANANHPAFARRLSERQNAFQETTRQVVSAPVEETGLSGGSATASAAAAAPASAGAPAAGY